MRYYIRISQVRARLRKIAQQLRRMEHDPQARELIELAELLERRST